MMVPTNWDPELLPRVASFEPAYLYGSLPDEPTLRNELDVPIATEESIEEEVGRAADLGIGFLYVMNAPCMANKELSEDGRYAILQRFEWLSEIGARGVVLSNPFIMELLAHWYSDLELHVSVLAEVASVNAARYYADLGAHTICVMPDVNRDIALLRSIREAVDCRLSMLVNEGCVFQCPLRRAHALNMSHSVESVEEGYYADYCYYACSYWKTADAVELIKAPWVRPQDLGVYLDMGIDFVKIAGREKMGQGPGSHTDWIVRVARAYFEGDYPDMRDLLIALEPPMSLDGSIPSNDPRACVDTAALDGFLDFFLGGHCTGECYHCGYCAEWARRAVTVDGDGSCYLAGLERDLNHLRIGDYRAARPARG